MLGTQQLRVLHLAGNKKSADTLGSVLSIGNLKASPTVTHFLQQRHTHFNKATLHNSATLYEIMGANYIQTALYSTPWNIELVTIS